MRLTWLPLLLGGCPYLWDPAARFETHSGTDQDTDADADADADADSDADTDADSDADTDADSDADSDSDTDADTDTHTGCPVYAASAEYAYYANDSEVIVGFGLDACVIDHFDVLIDAPGHPLTRSFDLTDPDVDWNAGTNRGTVRVSTGSLYAADATPYDCSPTTQSVPVSVTLFDGLLNSHASGTTDLVLEAESVTGTSGRSSTNDVTASPPLAPPVAVAKALCKDVDHNHSLNYTLDATGATYDVTLHREDLNCDLRLEVNGSRTDLHNGDRSVTVTASLGAGSTLRVVRDTGGCGTNVLLVVSPSYP